MKKPPESATDLYGLLVRSVLAAIPRKPMGRATALANPARK